MRHFFPLFATVAIILAAASCGSSKGATSSGNSGTNSTGTGGHGGSLATGGTNSGGSTGVLSGGTLSGGGGGDGGMCPTYKGTCSTQGFNCSTSSLPVTDGCGNTLDCGTCPTGQVCSSSNVCVTCTPKTCAQQGFNCGMATDGCPDNVTLDCGTCDDGGICGANSVKNVCGTGVCMPQSCSQQGFNCGMQSDTCGGSLDCNGDGGTPCPTGQLCMAGVCTTPVCTPMSCTQQGYNCGMATDTCGTVINCGTCNGSNVCGAGGPNVCGMNPCTGLCTDQVTCTGTATTSVSGTVYAPNGTDPLYNVLVYVPNGAAGAPTWGVQAFAPGVQCGACGSEVSGSPLVSTTTAVDGTFTLANVPVGVAFSIVIQDGRWRRKINNITIPATAKCVNTPLTAQLWMPATEAESDPADNIPLMAFSTGSVDSLECVLRKIGIADSQFSDPAAQGGAGRVRLYEGEGASGASYSTKTPSATQLWSGTTPDIDQYDMVYFPCQGAPYAKTAAEQTVVINYANAGGRIFSTHYSYVWLSNDMPFSGTADWSVGQADPTPDPQTGYINQTFARGMALAQWLQIVGASTTSGQIPVNTLRHDFNNVVAPSELWISLGAATIPPGTVPMHYTFDTPVGNQAAQQCGRVLFDDFHVENAATGPATHFPAECAATTTACTASSQCPAANPVCVGGFCTTFSPQEKMLEFMIFDLGSCVAPPTCTPRTCAQAATTCGAVGDGCGNILQCGTCPTNQACVSGMCQGCTPKTCASQSFTCGMQGDGCGDILSCGSCPSGQSCLNGKCGTGTCTPTTCSAQKATCGDIGDGCGDILNCGTCPTGQICGGGGVANQCFTPACVSKNCTQQGFTCGSATDGCGNTINCGSCTGTQTCGGCGTPNVCCGSG